MPDSYSVKLDVPIPVETEPELDWLIDFASLRGEGVFDQTWFDPVTHTLMLRPQQFTVAHTPTPEALTFPTPANWELVPVGSEANMHAMSKNGSTEKVETTASMPANQALVFSFFVFGQSGVSGVYEAARLYFGQYLLTIHSDGYCYIDATGLTQQSGHISVEQNGHRDSLSNRWIRLLVLPMNRRHILIYSDAGGAWVYKRPDLALTGTSNTIISEGKAGFAFPSTKALCQIQKATFPASGTYTTPVHDLGYAPRTGRAVTSAVSKDGGDVTLAVKDDAGAAFTPDGSKTKAKLEFTLTGGASTPLVYAAAVSIEGHHETRQGASRVVSYRGLTLGFESDAENDSALFTLDPTANPNVNGWPNGMIAGGSAAVLDENDKEVYLGILGEPAIEGAQAPAGSAQAAGLWRMLSQASFRTDWRLDNMTLSDIVKRCLRCAGFPDDSDRVEVQSYTGPAFPGDPRGKVTLFPVKAGESPARVLKMALELWMPSAWLFTVRQASDGKQKIYFGVEPTDRPGKTFYRSHLKGGWANAYWSNIKLRKVPKVCRGTAWNGVVVRGKDPDGTYIYAVYNDANAQNHALAESERPSNWFGAPVVKYYADDRLWTQAACDHVRDVLQGRYCAMVDEAEWTGESDKRLTRGSIVTLEGHGDFRIVSMRPSDQPTERASRTYRPVTYIGWKVE